jgi:hypothetical protein
MIGKKEVKDKKKKKRVNKLECEGKLLDKLVRKNNYKKM